MKKENKTENADWLYKNIVRTFGNYCRDRKTKNRFRRRLNKLIKLKNDKRKTKSLH